MSFIVYAENVCPRCHKAIMQSVFERHPSCQDLALHKFICADCGPVKTKIISLKPGESPPEVAA
jgi:hypothetical protein